MIRRNRIMPKMVPHFLVLLFSLTDGQTVDNKTVIPNQVYQPLGTCPCDFTDRICDIRCCCDKDCSTEELKLFESHCLPGPFGGQISQVPDYHCSARKEDSPDWFPFLCVISPPENNPYLGLFYHGEEILTKPRTSFKKPSLSAPIQVDIYRQGSPIFTLNNQLFTIPQMALGHCIYNAPVAFLENFSYKCVTLLQSCPAGYPLQTLPSDLQIRVNSGQGGEVTVEVIDKLVKDLTGFIPSGESGITSAKAQECENVNLALDYKFFWKGNSITRIILTRSVGAISVNVVLTTRYSAVFLSEELMSESNSGNPGYQVGRLIIAGIEDTQSGTFSVERTSINLWKPVNEGLCFTAEKQPILFAENSTSGCLLPVNMNNMSHCDLLRKTVHSLQATLVTAMYVAKSGNPNFQTKADWLNISFMNASETSEDGKGGCSEIPSHIYIHIWTFVAEMIDGNAQRNIQTIEVRSTLSTWTFEFGGGDITETQLFPVTSSVTFIDIPINAGPPKNRFQINFTEYDCNRNDVCWPQLAFPFTKYYTGEPHSQSLAKGLILVFLLITASLLGTPWRQIRQAWNSASL
uniref:tectonic-2 isoform X2 n=1 Tax=Doryrhamphus excisus TaxID=161450 RepID=UPI0025AE3E4D|nr:tectonic-2 isoform X2 [Doryrhamphus excisus]